MAWTGVSAPALWVAVDRGRHARSAVRFGVVFLLAVGLHTAWDSIASTTGQVVIAVLSLGLLLVTAHRFGDRRGRVAVRAGAASPA